MRPPKILILILILISSLAPIPNSDAQSAPLLQQLTATQGRIVTSQSHQFVVYAPAQTLIPEKTPTNSVIVEADFLALTAERVRRALTSELPALANNHDSIELGILPQAPADASITIGTTVFSDGIKYRVAIPPVVDQTRLVKGLLTVLLTQYANYGGERPVELPTWLIEGMAQQLYFSVGSRLVVDHRSTAFEVVARDFQVRTRETLRTNTSFTFHELTTFAPPPPNSSAEMLYQSGAHLLVQSLLQRPNGRTQFADFLQRLSKNWNWQTAFREAFHFERMLDVEKWWALAVVEFTTRDQRQAWSTSLSLQKLDALLATRLEIHNATNSLPETRLVDLAYLLEHTDWDIQAEALNEKISQLSFIAPHFAPQVGSLALEYKQAFESYLGRRATLNIRPTLRTTPEAQARTLAAETTRRVTVLDARRQKLVEPVISSTH